MIAFECAHCGAPLSAEDDAAKSLAICYNCGRHAQSKKAAHPKRSRPDGVTTTKRRTEPIPVVSSTYEPERLPTPRRGFGLAFGVAFGMVAAVVLVVGGIWGYKLASGTRPAHVSAADASNREQPKTAPASPPVYPALAPHPEKSAAELKREQEQRETIDALQNEGVTAKRLVELLTKDSTLLAAMQGARVKIAGKASFTRDPERLVPMLGFFDEKDKVFGVGLVDDGRTEAFRIVFIRKAMRTIRIDCLLIKFQDGVFAFEHPRLLDAD